MIGRGEAFDGKNLAPFYLARQHQARVNRLTVNDNRTGAAIADIAPEYLPAHIGARAPLMPRIIDAVRLRASVGEIADTLEKVWGRYQPSM